MAIGLCFIPAHNNDDRLIKYGIIGFFVVMDIFVIGLLIYELKKYRPNEFRIIEVLRTHNADDYFTWIYPHKLVRNRVQSYFLIFATEKKGRYRISLKLEADFQLIESLQAIITNTSYGYSAEKAKQFRKDPTAMLNRH